MRLENDKNKFRLAVTKSFKLDFAVCDDNLSRDQKKKRFGCFRGWHTFIQLVKTKVGIAVSSLIHLHSSLCTVIADGSMWGDLGAFGEERNWT